jgi:uncharacterized protein (DUF58 family)
MAKITFFQWLFSKNLYWILVLILFALEFLKNYNFITSNINYETSFILGQLLGWFVGSALLFMLFFFIYWLFKKEKIIKNYGTKGKTK